LSSPFRSNFGPPKCGAAAETACPERSSYSKKCTALPATTWHGRAPCVRRRVRSAPRAQLGHATGGRVAKYFPCSGLCCGEMARGGRLLRSASDTMRARPQVRWRPLRESTCRGHDLLLELAPTSAGFGAAGVTENWRWRARTIARPIESTSNQGTRQGQRAAPCNHPHLQRPSPKRPLRRVERGAFREVLRTRNKRRCAGRGVLPGNAPRWGRRTRPASRVAVAPSRKYLQPHRALPRGPRAGAKPNARYGKAATPEA
jgi:hypothetical protein